jgi:hypothetical protein
MCEYLKIYIAGPMRGIKDLNRKEFNKAEKNLEAKGIYQVINPCTSDLDSGLTDKELETSKGLRIVMARDLTDVCSCDNIYMLHGWQKSEGARIEHNLAVMLNLIILYQ